MKKLFFIFVCALFCSNQILAQDCSTDSVATMCGKSLSEEPLSPTLFHLYVMSIESDYEYILDYKYPNSVIAVRGNQRYIVDIRTGEELPFKENISSPKKETKPSPVKTQRHKNRTEDNDWLSEE